MSGNTAPTWIAGFWRRIGAAMLDSLILGIFGMIIGMFLETTLVEIGLWGRLLGFGIALLYFGVLNSQLANGQTLGKKALHLRVSDQYGQALSLEKSLLRYCLLSIPFFLNGVPLPNPVMNSFWVAMQSLLVIGGMLVIIYLYVFNRPGRQSLHDLAVGSYVVNLNVEPQPIAPVRPRHLLISGGIFAITALLPLLAEQLPKTPGWQPLLANLNPQQILAVNTSIQETLGKEPLVRNVNFEIRLNRDQQTPVTALVQVFLKENQILDKDLARYLADAVGPLLREPTHTGALLLQLVYGYDIGIANMYRSYTYRFNLNELATGQHPPVKNESGALETEINAYRQTLQSLTRTQTPQQWAKLQFNLANALWQLGEQTANPAQMELAVNAYQQALLEFTRDNAPLDWAATQNNLGIVLGVLGERDPGTERLEQSVNAFNMALTEYTRDKNPKDWAMVQNNLGETLRLLGERAADTELLEEAVAAHQLALEERRRDQAPLDWAMTQDNLGADWQALGERESGDELLQQAVDAYRLALQEYSRDKAPQDYAETQQHLGDALKLLADRETSTARLEEALAAYQQALAVWKEAGTLDETTLQLQTDITDLETEIQKIQ